MSGYFGKKPGFRIQPLTLSQIGAWFVAAARTITAQWTFEKSDSASQIVAREGAAATGNRFSVTAKADGGWLAGYAEYNGTNWIARATTASVIRLAGGTSIFYANTGLTSGNTFTPTELMRIDATGLGIGTSGAAGGRLEVRDTSSQIAFGTAADQGHLLAVSGASYFSYGVKWDGSAFKARQTAGSLISPRGNSIQFQLFTGATIGNSVTPTVGATLDATGLGVGATPACKVDAAGTIRSTAAAAPSSGAGVEIDYASTTGNVRCYDRTGAAFRALNLIGSTVNLAPSGTNVVTADSTRVDCTLPVRFPSYTPGTLPSAATHARSIVQVASTARGDRMARSNGTNWVYCEDEATTVTA